MKNTTHKTDQQPAAGGRASQTLEPAGLVRLLTSMAVAAEVVDALDDPALQAQRGWDLRHWTYEFVPWGVRFLFQGEKDVNRAVVALALPEFRRPKLAKVYARTRWPTALLMFG